MSANDPKKPSDSNPGGLPKAQNLEGDSLSEFDLSHEGLVEFGELPPSEEASRVALAQLPEPPSGQSLTTWTEVIRQQRAAQGQAPAGEQVKVDAPSDKDLLSRLGEAEAKELPSSTSGLRRSADTDELGSGELPVYAPPPAGTEGSAVDLGRALAGRAAGGSEVRFDILYPPSDAGGAIPLPARLPPLSSAAFQQAVAVPVPAGTYPPDESIPFAAPIGPGEPGTDFGSEASSRAEDSRSSILDVLLSESRYENPPEMTPPVRPKRPTMPNAGAAGPAHTVATQPGGLEHPRRAGDLNDLNGPDSALSVDESVDLYRPAGPPSLTESGTLEMPEGASEEIQRRLPPKESSAVDLGTPSSTGSVFDLDAAGGSGVRAASDAAIDLALPPLEDASGSEPAKAAQTKRRPGLKQPAKAPHVTPARVESLEPRGGGRFLAIGGALGLLLGAGGVLGAYFAGALPGRGEKPAATSAAAPPDQSAELTRLKLEADEARAEAVAAKTNANTATASVRQALADAGVPNADRPAEAIKGLAAAKAAADGRLQQLTAEANKQRDAVALARREADAAKKSLADAEKATDGARAELADARKAADAAKADLAKATKAGDDRVAEVRAAAAAKEKEALAKMAELAKREEEYAKLADAAKKAAEDAAKARDASEGALKAIGDRLAKAKFVGDKPDAAALVKGLDDALKAVSTDATASLREELVKARDQESKLKADLAAAREKEAAADKAATSLRAEAQKLQDQAKAADQKLAAETARLTKEATAAKEQAAEAAKLAGDTTKLKSENERLAKDAADAIAKAQAAEAAKAEADRVAADTARLKTENDRLTRDLEAVRELAEMLKSPAVTAEGPVAKPDPGKLADRFFANGLRAYYAGSFAEAESDLRKALQFRPDDARYHYLLGLTLWTKKDTAGAEAEFEKGRDAELAGRPSSRVISGMLERIQGPARQAVNAFRP